MRSTLKSGLIVESKPTILLLANLILWLNALIKWGEQSVGIASDYSEHCFVLPVRLDWVPRVQEKEGTAIMGRFCLNHSC